jgi:putative SOS response-associated peptidase YedK
MCNLYTERLSAAEVAAHFKVSIPVGTNAGAEVYPGGTGLVVREQNGVRVMQPMTWGWPMKFKTMSAAAKPKPVNNIADLRKSSWIGNARKPEWRCLIPLTGFAEAEGEKGSKTRTWLSIRDQPLFAWAGLWREDTTYGWGAVYSGVMTDCNEAIRPIHDRMPVLLMPDDYDRWLNGSLDDALAFQLRCFPDELIAMDRTSEPWAKRTAPEGTPDLL